MSKFESSTTFLTELWRAEIRKQFNKKQTSENKNPSRIFIKHINSVTVKTSEKRRLKTFSFPQFFSLLFPISPGDVNMKLYRPLSGFTLPDSRFKPLRLTHLQSGIVTEITRRCYELAHPG